MTEGRVNHIDAFCLGFGQWVKDGLDDGLQLTVLDAEAEWREGGWGAIEVVLDHIEDERLVWPEDAVERAQLFEAMWRLGWIGQGAQ